MSARSRVRGRRSGFALLTVLWVISGMVLLGVLANRTASEAIGAAQNRADALRAAWEMEGCLARVQAGTDAELVAAQDVEERWSTLDTRLSANGGLQGCDLTFVPAGVALDVNAADRETLLALFVAAGTPYEHADSLAGAIVRNAPFATSDALRLVPGLESPGPVTALLGVEPGRVLLSRAPAPVLSTLPGFGPEVVARLLEMRASGSVSLVRLSAALSPDALAAFQAHQMALASLVTTSPDAWIVTSRAQRRATGGTSSIELRLLHSGRRAAIMRHRSSPWS